MTKSSQRTTTGIRYCIAQKSTYREKNDPQMNTNGMIVTPIPPMATWPSLRPQDMICHNFGFVMSPYTGNNTFDLPVSGSVKPIIEIYTPHALFLIGVKAPVLIDRHAARLVPKNPLKAEAETVNLLIPLIPDLMPMVQLERLDLTQKMFECLSAVTRQLWLVRPLRARQV